MSLLKTSSLSEKRGRAIHAVSRFTDAAYLSLLVIGVIVGVVGIAIHGNALYYINYILL